MAENMLEHIAQTLGKDPIEVRLMNMNATDKAQLSQMIVDMKQTSNYGARVEAVDLFNRVCKWQLYRDT